MSNFDFPFELSKPLHERSIDISQETVGFGGISTARFSQPKSIGNAFNNCAHAGTDNGFWTRFL